MPVDDSTVRTTEAVAVAKGSYAVLVRRSAITHLVERDQRNVVLKLEGSDTGSMKLRIPSNDAAKNQAVVPPGHYLLFLVTKHGNDFVPSVSAPIQILCADLSCR